MSSSKIDRIADRVFDLLVPLTAERGLHAVDVEWRNEGGAWFLRVFLDKEGGITHQDCKEISHLLDAELEREGFIQKAYTLEVSSPGIERVLKSERDFLYFVGRRVLVKTSPPFEEQRDWLGTLGETTSEFLVLDTGGSEIRIPRKQIVKVRLSLD